MKNILLLSFAGILFSCGSATKQREFTKAHYIRAFVEKVGYIDMPYSHNLNLDKEDYRYLIDYKSLDTLFFDVCDNQIIGVLSDTSNYFAVLYYRIGDDLYPSLMTFNKSGERIDDKKICYGFCAGCDCECDSCADVTTISKDLKINMTYYIEATECDSIGNKLFETTTCKIFKIEGLIQPNGLIALNKEIEIDCE